MSARLLVALGVTSLGLAAFATPAHAGPPTRISISQNVVSVVAPPGQANAFQVSTEPGLVVIDDVFHPTAPVAPCRSAPVIFHEHRVVCPMNAATRIHLDAADGNDGVGIHGIGGTLLLGAGDDSMTGATGDLTVDLGPGNDTAAPNARQGIVTNNGPDEVIGGPGVDKATYLQHFFAVHVSLDDVANDGTRAGAEGDNIHSDVENIDGSFADDTLTGSAGPNELRGALGSDQLSGLGGNDTFLEGHFSRPYDRPDTLAGGDGVDTANYGGNAAPRWISLDDVANDGEAGENDNVRADVENVVGGAGNDVLVGNAADNTLVGGAGHDRADGGRGTDTCDAEVRQNCP